MTGGSNRPESPYPKLEAVEQAINRLEDDLKRLNEKAVTWKEFKIIGAVAGVVVVAFVTIWISLDGKMSDRVDNALQSLFDAKAQIPADIRTEVQKLPPFKYPFPLEDFGSECVRRGFTYNQAERSCFDPVSGATYEGEAVILMEKPFPPYPQKK